MLQERIQACLSRGDLREAAAATLRGYGPQIWRYVCTLVPDEEDARDVFQAFSEDLWRGLRTFRGDSSIRTWAYSVAWAAASRHRRDAFRRKRQRLATEDYSRLADSISTHLGLRRAGRQHALAELREALDPVERLLLTLRVDDQLSWEEVATVMSQGREEAFTPAALRKRFERLKARLSEEARARGLLD